MCSRFARILQVWIPAAKPFEAPKPIDGAPWPGLVCLSGFGTLNALSALGNYDARLPGLYDYWSATVGDGLLLPLAVASLVEVLARTEPVGGEPGWGVLGAAIGGLAGTTTQMAWLADDSPALNWTLPDTHL